VGHAGVDDDVSFISQIIISNAAETQCIHWWQTYHQCNIISILTKQSAVGMNLTSKSMCGIPDFSHDVCFSASLPRDPLERLKQWDFRQPR